MNVSQKQQKRALQSYEVRKENIPGKSEQKDGDQIPPKKKKLKIKKSE